MAAGGFSAGTAYVSVLPSLRGFQAKIRAEVKSQFPQGLTIDVKPRFDSGTMHAQAAAAAKGAGQTVRFKAELDRKSLSDSVIGVAALSRAMRTLTVPAGLVAATPYVLSFASSLVQAAGAGALLPAVLVAGGVAAGTLATGLSGVADTFKELAKADETAAATAATAGKARKAALESVRSAQEALADAQRSADRAAVQGAEQVADARQAVADAIIAADERIASARRAVADAVVAAQRDVIAAEDDLARSQERAQRAQESLTRARADAREELQQLQFSVEGAGLAEEEAADRLDEARKRLAEARAPRGAGAEEIDDLDRSVRQADLSLREASDRYADLQSQGREWAETGIEGSEGVVNANRELVEANRAVGASAQALAQARLDGDRAVADANAALTKAQIVGDRAVADARRDLGRTIVSVGQQQADAARAVQRASLALAAAHTAAGEAGAAGPSKAAAAMAKLSPAARDLVNQVRALGPAWTSMRLDVQDRLLTGVGTRINALGRNYIPGLNSALGLTADGYNRAARETLDWLNTASTTADVRYGLDNVALGINNSSDAMQPFLAAFRDFVVVGSEFGPTLGTSLTESAIRFRELTAEARESGRIREWIQGGIDTVKQFGRIIYNTGSIVRSVFGSINDTGRSTLDILEGITGRAAAALKAPQGASGLREFLITVRTLVGLVVDKLVQLWPVITSAAGAFAALLVGASPVTGLLFDLATLILPPLLDSIRFLAPVLGPAIALFGLWRASVAAGTLAIAAWRTAVALATAVNVAYQLAMGTNLVLTQAQTAAQSRFTLVKVAGTVATKAMAAAQWLLNAAMRANPIGIVITVLAALVAGVVWAYKNVGWFRDIVDGAWRAIASVSNWLWDKVLKPVLDRIVAGLNYVGDNFDGTVNRIGEVWGRIRGLLAKPVNFMIHWVWNEGLRKAWNVVSTLWGAKDIAPMGLIPEMAEGGPIRHGTPGKDNAPILAMRDEFVVRRKYAKPARPFLDALNAGEAEALQAAGVRPYAAGGAVGAIQNASRVARSMHGKPYRWGGSGPTGTDCSGFMAYITRALRGEADPYRRIGTTADFPWPGFRLGLQSAFGVGNVAGSHMRGTLAGMNVESGGAHGYVAAGPPARGAPYGANYHLPEIGGAFVGGGGGGGGWGLAEIVKKAFRDFTDPAINKLPGPPPEWQNVLRGTARKARDEVLNFALRQVGIADQGGLLSPGWNAIYNGTGTPERALPPMETRAYDTLTRLLNSGRLSIGSDDAQAGAPITNHTWNVYEVNDAAETAMKIQRRQEMAARTGAPL